MTNKMKENCQFGFVVLFLLNQLPYASCNHLRFPTALKKLLPLHCSWVASLCPFSVITILGGDTLAPVARLMSLGRALADTSRETNYNKKTF